MYRYGLTALCTKEVVLLLIVAGVFYLFVRRKMDKHKHAESAVSSVLAALTGVFALLALNMGLNALMPYCYAVNDSILVIGSLALLGVVWYKLFR